jgi:DNA ligase 1
MALASKREELSELYYFFLIKLAPAYDSLETGVGHGIMVKAVSKACGLTSAQARTKFQKEGDLGDVAATSLKGQKNIFSFFKKGSMAKLSFMKVF